MNKPQYEQRDGIVDKGINEGRNRKEDRTQQHHASPP